MLAGHNTVQLRKNACHHWLQNLNKKLKHKSKFIFLLSSSPILVKSKVGDCSRGRPKGFLFNSYYIEVYGRALPLSLDCSTLSLLRTLYSWVLSKEVSSTILKDFGVTRPGIESRSPGPLANTLNTRIMNPILHELKNHNLCVECFRERKQKKKFFKKLGILLLISVSFLIPYSTDHSFLSISALMYVASIYERILSVRTNQFYRKTTSVHPYNGQINPGAPFQALPRAIPIYVCTPSYAQQNKTDPATVSTPGWLVTTQSSWEKIYE